MENSKYIGGHKQEQELIRKYLEDTLTREEELVVADLYQKDADFRDAIDGLEQLNTDELDDIMSSIDAKIESVTISSSSSDESESETPEPITRNLYPWKNMAIAASVVIFFLVGSIALTTQLKSTNQKIVENAFEPIPYPDMVTRGSGDELSNLEKIAISAYNTENYEVSAEHFLKLHKKYPENTKYSLFLGISYMGLNKVDKAIEVLESIESNEKFEDDIRWYLALAYLKTKNKDKARVLFEELADSSSYYRESAIDIYDMLNK